MRKNLLEMAIRLYSKGSFENNFTYNKVKMMSFLFKGNKLISVGINSERTDPVQNLFRMKSKNNEVMPPQWLDKCHCEIDCLKKFYYKQKENYLQYTLLVISIKSDGTMRTSKPCKTCSKFLKEMGIGEICYFDNGKFVSEKLIKK